MHIIKVYIFNCVVVLCSVDRNIPKQTREFETYLKWKWLFEAGGFKVGLKGGQGDFPA
jgi:hypothetical protein